MATNPLEIAPPEANIFEDRPAKEYGVAYVKVDLNDLINRAVGWLNSYALEQAGDPKGGNVGHDALKVDENGDIMVKVTFTPSKSEDDLAALKRLGDLPIEGLTVTSEYAAEGTFEYGGRIYTVSVGEDELL